MVQEGGIMSKLTHPLRAFRADHQYIRESLRWAEQAIASGDWKAAEAIYAEVSAIGGLLEEYAQDNHHWVCCDRA